MVGRRRTVQIPVLVENSFTVQSIVVTRLVFQVPVYETGLWKVWFRYSVRGEEGRRERKGCYGREGGGRGFKISEKRGPRVGPHNSTIIVRMYESTKTRTRQRYQESSVK